jgi:hypothetical protein
MAKRILKRIQSVEDSLTGARFLSSQAMEHVDKLGERASLSPIALILDRETGTVFGVIADGTSEHGHFRRVFTKPGILFEDYMMEFVPRIEGFQSSGFVVLHGGQPEASAETTQFYHESEPTAGLRPQTGVTTQVDQQDEYFADAGAV